MLIAQSDGRGPRISAVIHIHAFEPLRLLTDFAYLEMDDK